MKTKLFSGVLLTLSLTSANVHANWLCNIANKQGQQWTVAAPDENTAEIMSQRVCKTGQIKPKDCIPDCYDNGITLGRWHCAVTNKQGQHWSYFAPTQQEAEALAQHGCDIASLTPVHCKPTCIPE